MKKPSFTLVELVFLPILLLNVAFIGMMIWGIYKLVTWLTAQTL